MRLCCLLQLHWRIAAKPEEQKIKALGFLEANLKCGLGTERGHVTILGPYGFVFTISLLRGLNAFDVWFSCFSNTETLSLD